MKIKNLGHWGKDYLKAIHTYGYSLFYKKPPKHFLEFTNENKSPIILIPGVWSPWQSLRQIANKLSLEGHPIYVLEGLNTKTIPASAAVIDKLIKEKKLTDIFIISHSKGGLIGKHLLAFSQSGSVIKKLIAIACPFAGSNIVKFIPTKAHQELHPKNKAIQELDEQKAVNQKIVSIYGIFDNHVWPLSSSQLVGAKNIQVNVHGHHKILFDNKVGQIVLREVES